MRLSPLRLGGFLFSFVLTLLVSGCAEREGNRYPTAHPTAGSLGVIYPPVAVGSLTTTWPSASLDLAHHLAWRVDAFDGRRGYDGLACETPMAVSQFNQLGAKDVVVQAELTEQVATRSAAGPRRRATALLRAYDRSGRLRAEVQGTGESEDLEQPKLLSPATQPPSLAAISALNDANDRLLPLLLIPVAAVAPPPAAVGAPPETPMPATVAVTIDSSPSHADVLIDGRFRGTTPLAITLPTTKPCTIRIERQGFRPWSRELTPEPEMQLQPALEAETPHAQ